MSEKKKITLKWYSCPHKFETKGDNSKLKFSVLLMPELSGGNTLDEFEPFKNWPKTVKGLKFALRMLQTVLSLAITSDNTKVVSGSADNTIKIWKLDTGELLKTLPGHDNSVLSLAITSDNTKVVSGSADKTIKIWKLDTGELLKTLPGHNNSVLSLAITSDNTKVVSGSADKTIKIWKLDTGELLKTLPGHDNSVLSLAITSDNTKVVSGSADKTIKIWKLDTGELLKTLPGHDNSVLSLAITSDNTKVVSGSADNTIKIWKLDTDELLKTLPGHDNSVLSLAITSDNTKVVSGSADNTIKIWKLDTDELPKTLPGHNNSVLSLAITSDNTKVVSGSADNTIKIWKLDTDELPNTYHVDVILPDLQRYLLKDKIKDKIEDDHLNYWTKIFPPTTNVLSSNHFSLSNFNKKRIIFFPTKNILGYVKENFSITGKKSSESFPTDKFYSFRDGKSPKFPQNEINISCNRGHSKIIPLKVIDKPHTWIDFILTEDRKPKYGHVSIANSIDEYSGRTDHEAQCTYTAPKQGNSDSDSDKFSIIALNRNTLNKSKLIVNVIFLDGTDNINQTLNTDTNSSTKEIVNDDIETSPSNNNDRSTLSEIALVPDNEKFLEKSLNKYLDRFGSFLSNNNALLDSNKMNFFRVKYCHDKIKSKYTDNDISQSTNIIDFHDIVNELSGDYSNFVRYIGLVPDFEIPLEKIKNFNLLISPITKSGEDIFKEIRISSDFDSQFGGNYDVDEKRIWTVYKLNYDSTKGSNIFLPVSRKITENNFDTVEDDKSDGWFLFEDGKHEITTLDITGTAYKLSNFSSNMSRSIAYDEDMDQLAVNSESKSKDFALPSLRTAGFSIIDPETAKKLEDQLKALDVLHNSFTQADEDIHVDVNYLTTGYRVDVKDSDTNEWKSLCYRVGKYTFQPDGDGNVAPKSIYISEEGYISLAPTSSSDDIGIADQQYLFTSELLFKWNGWGLCTEPVGKTLGPNGGSDTQESNRDPLPADFKYPLWVTFMYRRDKDDNPPSLPKLRFGRYYSFRMRSVDLTGNSISVTEDSPIDQPKVNKSYIIPKEKKDPNEKEGIKYLRYEPVLAPIVVLRKKLPLRGESVHDIVIRTSPGVPVEDSERHIAPPKVSQDMAEKHGMFDKLFKKQTEEKVKRIAYDYLTKKKDGLLEDTPYEDDLKLPYLPDPIVKGVTFRGLPNSISINSIDKFEFKQVTVEWKNEILWKERQPFRIVVKDFNPGRPGDTAEQIRQKNKPQFDESQNLLIVRVKAGHVADVKMSCYLELGKEEEMAVYDWITENSLTDLSEIKSLIEDGKHWMITPYQPLRIINAVQIPPPVEIGAAEADKAHLEIVPRSKGDNAIVLQNKKVPQGEIKLDGLSTQKVVIKASWKEIIEDELETADGIKLFKSEEKTFQDIAFEIPIEIPIDDTETNNLTVYNKHQFMDTKYRKVTYKSVAISRFKDYFKENAQVEKESVYTQTIDVFSSIRPQSPKVLYPVPIFKWTDSVDKITGKVMRERSGGGIRVYLDRPFYSSGVGELLGVVLFKYKAEEIDPTSNDFKIVKNYVSQWGKDTISISGSLPNQKISPSLSDFNKSSYKYPGPKDDEEKKFLLDELENAGYKNPIVSVVGFPVKFDSESGRYYCDIELNPGSSYFPFVNLKLISFQKNSIRDVECSRVVDLPFMQLTPNRYAFVKFDELNDKFIEVTVSGIIDAAKVEIGKITVRAKIEVEIEGNFIPWKTSSDDYIIFDLDPNGTYERIWKKVIELPYSVNKCRLRIEEIESFCSQYNKEGKCERWEERLNFYMLKLKELVELKEKASV